MNSDKILYAGENHRFDFFLGDGAGITGKTVTVNIRRSSDNYWWNGSSWQSGIYNLTATETDSTNLPGLYHYDLAGAQISNGLRYTVKMSVTIDSAPMTLIEQWYGSTNNGTRIFNNIEITESTAIRNATFVSYSLGSTPIELIVTGSSDIFLLLDKCGGCVSIVNNMSAGNLHVYFYGFEGQFRGVGGSSPYTEVVFFGGSGILSNEGSPVLYGTQEANLSGTANMSNMAINSTVAKEATLTTILNRIGAFTGTGVNTILGFLRSMFRSDLSAPSDMGGTATPANDSQQAIRAVAGQTYAGMQGIGSSMVTIDGKIDAVGTEVHTVNVTTTNTNNLIPGLYDTIDAVTQTIASMQDNINAHIDEVQTDIGTTQGDIANGTAKSSNNFRVLTEILDNTKSGDIQ